MIIGLHLGKGSTPGPTPTGEVRVVETPFTDLEDASDAHRHNIGRVYGLGITTGRAQTTFSPLACADRGRMASLLARLHSVLTGATAAVVATPFTDLNEASSTLGDDIGLVYGLGITSGTSDTTFSPDACTTRQQMASLLVRTYRAATIAGRSSHTSDTEGLDTPE